MLFVTELLVSFYQSVYAFFCSGAEHKSWRHSPTFFKVGLGVGNELFVLQGGDLRVTTEAENHSNCSSCVVMIYRRASEWLEATAAFSVLIVDHLMKVFYRHPVSLQSSSKLSLWRHSVIHGYNGVVRALLASTLSPIECSVFSRELRVILGLLASDALLTTNLWLRQKFDLFASQANRLVSAFDAMPSNAHSIALVRPKFRERLIFVAPCTYFHSSSLTQV